jgi:hypothetical protein
MNYKPPTSPVFWVPVPDTGQSRMDLIDWKITPGKEPPQMILTNPETKNDYTVEILDYFGPYPIDNLPGFIAREIINKDATSHILQKLLTERVPEFKHCKKVFFYQVNPINQTT